MTIEQVDKVDFWDEVEAQLAEIVSESGRLVVNRLAGMIQITDQHRRVEEVARFVNQLNRSIYRQVDIDVKIVQVVLREDYALGIDWSRLVSETSTGQNWDFNINNTVTSPAGGFAPLSNAVNLVFSDIGDDGANNLTAVITALEEQGDVEVVSQPRIRTLNNQSALIKVGTDRTFFRREQLTDSTSAGSQVFSTDVPQVCHRRRGTGDYTADLTGWLDHHGRFAGCDPSFQRQRSERRFGQLWSRPRRIWM